MIQKKSKAKKGGFVKNADKQIMDEHLSSLQGGLIVKDDEKLDSQTGEIKSTTESTFYKFEKLKFVMEKGEWFMHMTLDANIPKMYWFYVMRWTVDLSKIEEQLDEVRGERQDYQESLLAEEDQKVYSNFERREAEILQQKSELIRMMPDLEFDVALEKAERKNNCYIFKISPDSIEELNKHRLDEEYYKICFIRK